MDNMLQLGNRVLLACLVLSSAIALSSQSASRPDGCIPQLLVVQVEGLTELNSRLPTIDVIEQIVELNEVNRLLEMCQSWARGLRKEHRALVCCMHPLWPIYGPVRPRPLCPSCPNPEFFDEGTPGHELGQKILELGRKKVQLEAQ